MVIIRRRSKQRVAAYKYQRDSRYFVQIAEGLIEAGAEELAELGAEDIASIQHKGRP